MRPPIISGVTESPCEKFQCHFWNRCKTEKMSCMAFAAYANYGRAGMPTPPSREIFEKIFKEEEVDDEGF